MFWVDVFLFLRDNFPGSTLVFSKVLGCPRKLRSTGYTRGITITVLLTSWYIQVYQKCTRLTVLGVFWIPNHDSHNLQFLDQQYLRWSRRHDPPMFASERRRKKNPSQSWWNRRFKNDRCIQLIISSFSSNESILKHQVGVKPLEK